MVIMMTEHSGDAVLLGRYSGTGQIVIAVTGAIEYSHKCINDNSRNS